MAQWGRCLLQRLIREFHTWTPLTYKSLNDSAKFAGSDKTNYLQLKMDEKLDHFAL